MPYSGMYSGAGYTDGSYWLFRLEPQGVTRIDGTTHKTLKTLTIPIAVPGGVHVDGGTIWVSNFNAPRVIGIDVASGIQTRDYQLAASPADQAGAISLTVGAGSLWIGRPEVAELLRVDPGTGKVQAGSSSTPRPCSRSMALPSTRQEAAGFIAWTRPRTRSPGAPS